VNNEPRVVNNRPAAVFLAAGDCNWSTVETLLISRGYIRL